MLANYVRPITGADGRPMLERVEVDIPDSHVRAAVEAAIAAAVECGRAGGEVPHMANAATDAVMARIPAGLPPAVMVQPANALHRWIRREAGADPVAFVKDLDLDRAVEAQLAAIAAGAGL